MANEDCNFCDIPVTQCYVGTCGITNTCSFGNAPAGTACSENGGTMCNADGQCVN